ncbi:MAG TPA: CoA-transferase [Terriglobales bacterium]
MADAIALHVRDGDSVCMGVCLEQMIPFAAGHEIIRQKMRDLRLIGPISDILFDQIIAAGCVKDVVAAWVGNVMIGSAYGFRRAFESSPWATYEGNPGDANKREGFRVFNMTNFTVSLALQAGAMGVPFLPTRSVHGSDVPKNNHFYYQIMSPFANEDGEREMVMAVRAIQPDVTIVQVQRSDEDGNAHCWGNLGILSEAVRAAKKVIVCTEQIVPREVIRSDPNRTVIPGFLVTAVCEVPWGGHPSPVQGHYSRDNEYFREYHQQTKDETAYAAWAEKWVYGVNDRAEYMRVLGEQRAQELKVKKHAYAAEADFGY